MIDEIGVLLVCRKVGSEALEIAKSLYDAKKDEINKIYSTVKALNVSWE